MNRTILFANTMRSGIALNTQFQKRFITVDSWVAEDLAKQGVPLSPSTDPPGTLTTVTPELLRTASPKVLQISDKIVQLNQIELAQLWKLIKVAADVENYLFDYIFFNQ